jgi:5'-nucleotidase
VDRPTVLIDVDSVMVEHSAEYLRGLNHAFGTNYNFEDITDFDYTFLQPAERDYIFKCWQSSHIYDKDVLSSEQLSVLAGLREVADVVACSSPMIGHIKSKYGFLLRYFDRKHIILASEKWRIRGDVLIDDAPHNIYDFVTYTDGQIIVYDRPWNRSIQGVPRVHNWAELGPVVLEILNERGYSVY